MTTNLILLNQIAMTIGKPQDDDDILPEYEGSNRLVTVSKPRFLKPELIESSAKYSSLNKIR